MVTVTMWALSPLFVRYFASYYDVWTQNAFRYTCASLILLGVMAYRRGRGYRLSSSQWKRILPIALTNLVMQTFFAATFYYIYPAVAILVMRANVIFVTVLAFFIFPDERPVIRSKGFLFGAFLTLAGVITVIFAQDPELLRHLAISRRDFWFGVFYALGYGFFLAIYALTIKHAMIKVAPVVTFTYVCCLDSVGMIALMLLFGGAAGLVGSPPLPLGLMVLSALLFLIFAHTSYYASLRHLKASVAGIMLQLTPVLTCVLSAIVYGDILTPVQIAGGAAALVGAGLASRAQAKQVEPEFAEEVNDPLRKEEEKDDI